MKKPAHALLSAQKLEVTVFEKGKRNALFEATGTDPSHIAKAVAEHPALAEHERSNVRPKLRTALQAFVDKAIPNMTTNQLEIGGRRLRIKAIA
jgi:hypothetical protein